MTKIDFCCCLLQRFVPSEFGHDVDRVVPVEPGLTMYREKHEVRRSIEECGVPYTYICCNSIASWPYYDNTHPSEVLPPLDHFQIYGDGTVKGNHICYLSIYLSIIPSSQFVYLFFQSVIIFTHVKEKKNYVHPS